MAVKCGECNYLNGAHTAWCSQNRRNRDKPPPRNPGYQEEKRNFKKRPDDGRSKKR